MPMKNPPHPGDFIRTEVIEAAGLTVTGAAIALGVSRPTLSSLLNGKAGLSGEMALRIEKAFGVKHGYADAACRRSSYDIAQTRKREGRRWAFGAFLWRLQARFPSMKLTVEIGHPTAGPSTAFGARCAKLRSG